MLLALFGGLIGGSSLFLIFIFIAAKKILKAHRGLLTFFGPDAHRRLLALFSGLIGGSSLFFLFILNAAKKNFEGSSGAPRIFRSGRSSQAPRSFWGAHRGLLALFPFHFKCGEEKF